ncbi:tetraacyldisaccharide 4'-kinase [Pseudodesulfovibrio thermohalotolerans]|uniref:tetraacyldisaccharide 4'-kinase n=1 Tax=Pseudodesulfovibrio thermohalotolerans TaxID=2880651 RepID=UPI0024416A33|nr:tetraacyldisaccharide 4'-kinase [Pseudodesulfovibrio thermohalotolerans]WFS61944.1 tetraacyldisaccharide 4'-kinase [Pseudodesulfovibrio thermohalotolerans]
MSETVTELQRTLSPVLRPVSWLYGGLMRARAGLYRRGLFRRWEASALTVSVGNIGWGGSGKTPVADWLLGWAESRSIPVVLLTRGYRAKPKNLPYEVKPGALAEEAGDEPLMLARAHQKALILVDPNRTRAGRLAMRKARPELVILDDGFQHMAVERHVNLVLLRPDDLGEGWNRVIPAGSWREPEAALERADAFMIKTDAAGFEALRPSIDNRLSRFGKPVFSFRLAPSGVRRVVGGDTARDFGGAPYLLATGVGDPAQVRATAEGYLGYAPVRHRVFRDHHDYSKLDALDLAEEAARLGCAAVLCTPKDAVKLGPMCTNIFWQFDLSLEFGPSTLGPDAPFSTWWERRYESFSLRRADRLEHEADFRMRRGAER